MAENDGSVVIAVEPDEPELDLETAKPEGEIVEAKPEKPEPKPAEVETPKIEGVEELRAQLEAARRQGEAESAARRAAEEQVAQERGRVSQAHTQIIDSHLASIDSATQAETAKLAAAKQEYKIAWEAGNSDAVAEAADKIAASRAVLLRLDEGKADLEARKAAAPQSREPERRQAPQPAQRQPADALETAIANLSPRTQAWLRKHPECVNDEKMNRKANAAHQMALSEGYIPDSDAYFDYCENFLGYKTEEETPQPQPKPQSRTRPMAAAPVRNGSTQSNGNLGEGQVVLTKGEQEAATDGVTHVWNYDDPKGKFKKGEPIGLREMARRKLALMKAGAYDRSPTGT